MALESADQTLHNCLKADREERLGGAGAKPVTPEQMELARLLAKLARTKMEFEIIKKPRRTSRSIQSEVSVYRQARELMVGVSTVRAVRKS
jgi:hypothetical protein